MYTAWSLAYQALVKNPPEFYLKQRDLFLGDSEKLGTGTNAPDFVYRSEDIVAFNSLVTHSGNSGKEPAELMMQSLVTVFLLRCLHHSGYLRSADSSGAAELSADELFFAAVLQRFMRVTFYNSHEMSRADSRNLEVTRIGRATNPSLALVNHSCYPNYRRLYVGNRTLAFATRPIPKGAEISDTYTQAFAVCPKQERLRALKKYNFVCDCRACAEDWPLLSELRLERKKAALKDSEAKALAKTKARVARAKSMEQRFALQASYVQELFEFGGKASAGCCPSAEMIEAEHELFRIMLAVTSV